jgi:diacylglycerol kinase
MKTISKLIDLLLEMLKLVLLIILVNFIIKFMYGVDSITKTLIFMSILTVAISLFKVLIEALIDLISDGIKNILK